MTAYQSNIIYSVDSIQLREPDQFSAGDELVFKKNLPTFLPSNGWSLLYVLTDETGVEIATVTSIPGSGDLNNWHIIDVVGFEPALAQGTYIFAGYAINGAERRQIYYGWLVITPNFPSATATDPQTTHAQRMILLLEQQLERLATYDFSSTDVQRNRFMLVQREKVLEDLKYYKELRSKELDYKAAANGRPNRQVTNPIFNLA